MHLNQYRQAVLTTLQQAFPHLNDVAYYQGALDNQALKRIVTRLPTLKLALLGVTSIKPLETQECEASLHMAAFIITNDLRRLEREHAALALVESLTVLLNQQQWNYPYARPAHQIKAENLFNGEVDKQGIALWVVSWQQTLRLGDSIWQEGQLPREHYLPEEQASEVG